jgi:hypothetical protein
MAEQKELRANLWHKKTTAELQGELDLIISKMSLLQSMMGRGGIPSTITGLYTALEHALTTVSELLNNKLNGR